MRKTVLNLWLEALTSGRYKQGRESLCQVNTDGSKSYCCLGVLCDLYNKERRKKKKPALKTKKENSEDTSIGKPLNGVDSIILFDECEGHLPKKVARWAGFRSGNCSGIFHEKDMPELITLNDGTSGPYVDVVKKHSFAQIAEIIERYHEHL
jgi:hypothetical protein